MASGLCGMDISTEPSGTDAEGRKCALREDGKTEHEPLKSGWELFFNATYSLVPSIGVFPLLLLIAIRSFPFTTMEIVMCNPHAPPALP